MHEETIKLEFSRRTAILCLLCTSLGAVGYSASVAFADDDPATQNLTTGDLVLPYEGHLKVDAAGATGAMQLRFELFTAPTGGAPVWSEERVVPMHNGRFSVGLGTVTRLNEVVLDAQKLWLGLTILEDDGAGGTVEVGLAGRQSIEPAPYAAWSAHAADHQTAGDLSVAGGVTAGGDLEVGRDLEIGGASLHLGTGDVAGFGDGGKAMAQGPGDALLLNPDGDFAERLEVGASLGVDGSLDVGGDVTLGDGDDTITFGGEVQTERALRQLGPLRLNAHDLTGVSALEGASGLEFGATAISGVDLGIDAAGDVTAAHDVSVGGVIRAYASFNPSLPASAPRGGVNNHSQELILVSEGVCYLTSVRVTHLEQNPSPMSCELNVVNNRWVLRAQGGLTTRFGNTSCRAQCFRF